MQVVTMYAVAHSTLGVVRDYANAQGQNPPTFTIGSPVMLKLRLFEDYNESTPYPIANLSAVVSWQAVFDRDFAKATTPPLVADHANITCQSITETINGSEYTFTEVGIPIPDMNTQELATLLGNAEEFYGLHMELVGFDSNADETFVLQIKNFTVRNRIYFNAEPTEQTPDFLTASQVRALVAAGVDLQYSTDGSTNWHDTQATGDVYFRFRSASDSSAAWSSGIALPAGAPGANGASAYQIWLEAGNTGTEEDFLDSLVGPQGPQGQQGPQGPTGPQGPVNALSIGTVSTLSPGSDATAEIVGTYPNQKINFGIPKGQDGDGSPDMTSYYTKTQISALLDGKASNTTVDSLGTRLTNAEIAVNGKQDTLPSGATGKFLKKTAKGVEWDTPAGGSSVTVDTSFVENSTNPVQSKVIQAALSSLQASIGGRLPVVASEADMLDYAVGLDRAKEFGLCLYSGTGEDAGYAGGLTQGHLYLVIGPNLTAGQVVQSESSGNRSSSGPPAYTYHYTTTDTAYEIDSPIPPGGTGQPDWNGTYTGAGGDSIFTGPTCGAEPDSQGKHWGDAYYYTYDPDTQTLTRSHYDQWGEVSSYPQEYGVLVAAYDEVIDTSHGFSSADVSETTVETLHEETVVMHMGLAIDDPWADLYALVESIFNGISEILASIWCFDLTPMNLFHQRQTVFLLPGLPAASAAYTGASVLLTTDGKLYQCRGTTSNGTTTYVWQDVTPWISGSSLESRIAALEAFHFGTLTVSHTGTAPTGAQWSVDSGTTWRDFGTSATLAPGSYTVTFKSITGYTAPSSQSVTLTAGGTETVSVAYTATATTGTVTLTFSGTPPQGAGWTIDGNSYTSGQTATLDPGTYAITYASVTGYDSPSTPSSVTVAAGDTLTLSAEYTEQSQGGSSGFTASGGSYSYLNGTWTDTGSTTTYNGNSYPVYQNGSYYLAMRSDGKPHIDTVPDASTLGAWRRDGYSAGAEMTAASLSGSWYNGPLDDDTTLTFTDAS